MTVREPNPSKTALRDRILTARNRRALADVVEDGRAIADVATNHRSVRRAATVAAYVSFGSEPGTGELLDRLRAAGKRVLLPVLLPDNDLDWAPYDGALAPARRGMLEPPGPTLGVDAIAGADLVLVPGLAVSHAGERLGRGGGSYDRALTRVPRGTEIWIVLYGDEVGVDVPVEPHDRPVTAALTPGGVVTLD